jgi:hypothetical protein
MARRIACFVLCLTLTALPLTSRGQTPSPDTAILTALESHEYDLAGNGRDFLLTEGKNNDFFLLGELHGDNEIPDLLHVLWPRMWHDGYRYVAAEVSPWTAHQLETMPAGAGPRIKGLWTRQQASDIRAFAPSDVTVLWGCDMEEIHPEYLIRDLAALNPGDPSLKPMVSLTSNGYSRKMASDLLALMKSSNVEHDAVVNGISLRQNLLATLEIEKNRSSPESKMTAQNQRELLLKTQFLEHFRQIPQSEPSSKVFLRFGRNHLHRGYDARGISTLGNFIAEFAVSRGQKAFNVGAFGAGGKETLLGETFDADERPDEPTFALLADHARYSATVYDLRPLRPVLHAIPQERRTALQTNLVYWADSYDALICYKNVTPLKD